jgi:hypothetical protein
MPIGGGSPRSGELAKETDALAMQAKKLREEVKNLMALSAKVKPMNKEEEASRKADIKAKTDRAHSTKKGLLLRQREGVLSDDSASWYIT